MVAEELIEESEGGDRPLPSLLRQLVDTRDRQIQKARIQFGNRLSAIDRGTDPAADITQRAMVERWAERFAGLEGEIDADIRRIVAAQPIYAELSKVRGIGPMLAAKLIALIDIAECDTISALWRFAGLAVIDGQRERLVKGEPAHYNGRLKTAMYLIGGSFLKSRSPYRVVYDDGRAYYKANRPEWTEGHCHLAALRKMEKIFLSHLHTRWRKLEGMPTREPYVQEKLGHTHILLPSAFGWAGD